LIDAAMRLFAKDGFAATSMEAIAREAGASTKTIYARYANKEDMLGAVTHRVADRILKGRGEIAIDPAGAEPEKFLTEFGRQLASMFENPEIVGMARLAIAEAHRMPALSDFFVASFTRNVTALRQLLEAWQKAGKLKDLPPDSQDAARIFIEMASGIPRIRALIGKPLSGAETNRHVKTAVTLFLKGCGYRG
jgi:AcrR family transcriptional regulator